MFADIGPRTRVQGRRLAEQAHRPAEVAEAGSGQALGVVERRPGGVDIAPVGGHARRRELQRGDRQRVGHDVVHLAGDPALLDRHRLPGDLRFGGAMRTMVHAMECRRRPPPNTSTMPGIQMIAEPQDVGAAVGQHDAGEGDGLEQRRPQRLDHRVAEHEPEGQEERHLAAGVGLQPAPGPAADAHEAHRGERHAREGRDVAAEDRAHDPRHERRSHQEAHGQAPGRWHPHDAADRQDHGNPERQLVEPGREVFVVDVDE